MIGVAACKFLDWEKGLWPVIYGRASEQQTCTSHSGSQPMTSSPQNLSSSLYSYFKLLKEVASKGKIAVLFNGKILPFCSLQSLLFEKSNFFAAIWLQEYFLPFSIENALVSVFRWSIYKPARKINKLTDLQSMSMKTAHKPVPMFFWKTGDLLLFQEHERAN